MLEQSRAATSASFVLQPDVKEGRVVFSAVQLTRGVDALPCFLCIGSEYEKLGPKLTN